MYKLAFAKQGNIAPFHDSNIPTGITSLGVCTDRQEFRLTVLYLNWRLQMMKGKITRIHDMDIPTGITFLGVSLVRQKFRLTVMKNLAFAKQPG